MDIPSLKNQFEKDSFKLGHEDLKNKYLGRKNGLVNQLLKDLARLPIEEKRRLGTDLNNFRVHIENKLEILKHGSGKQKLDIDLTVPEIKPQIGHLHPLTQTQRELEQIFMALGFSIELGPEIETDWYNFTALNFPEGHPARDMQDTFFLAGQEGKPSRQKLLLRTHTSPVQIRYMEKHKPPFAIIVPGTVYRNEATDATHEHTFDQLEGLVVGQDITFANMIWVLNYALKKLFGLETKTKLLPAYFPFVEPGAEMAMSSPKFKNGKWVELVGCGMVHQNVFAAAGYPKNKYQGFAFGFGSIRFPLMKYGINDIRLLRENNLQFLHQF